MHLLQVSLYKARQEEDVLILFGKANTFYQTVIDTY